MSYIVLKAFTIFCFMQTNVFITHAQKARLLTSYLPASMQAIAYYIDQLQYEPLPTGTVEPPFNVDLNETVYEISTAASIKRNSTTKSPNIAWSAPSWWQQSTTTKVPAQYASKKPLSATTTTSTKRPNNVWQVPSWWQTETTKKPTTTTTSTTKAPTSSTSRPYTSNANGWWQPPVWWQNPLSNISTTEIPPQSPPPPTRAHAPAIYAPLHNERNKEKSKRLPEGYEIFCEFDDSDTETLAKLPSELIHDIRTEAEHDHFTNDVESLDNFLRLYDDNYGRDTFSNIDSVLDRWSSTSTAGKKRIPPNKPYVEFLLVYDLLKRDAKAENLSKYEGYSEDMVKELHELSSASAPRQLYTLFKRMLDRRDIQRSDVVSHIQRLVKELGNAQSETSKALQPIQAMQFLL